MAHCQRTFEYEPGKNDIAQPDKPSLHQALFSIKHSGQDFSMPHVGQAGFIQRAQAAVTARQACENCGLPTTGSTAVAT